MFFFEFFLAIILLEIIANVCEKTAIFSKFDLWWPLVTSILTWPGNDLYKSWRSRRSLSNAVCRMSLRCVVFEISGGGRIGPPRTELALKKPDRNRVNTESYGLVVKVTPMLTFWRDRKWGPKYITLDPGSTFKIKDFIVEKPFWKIVDTRLLQPLAGAPRRRLTPSTLLRGPGQLKQSRRRMPPPADR